jgi:hypothetical protein
MPTLRRAMGPVWSTEVGRPVTGGEHLTSLGFIAHASLSATTGMPILLPRSFLAGSPSAIRQCAGNAMHLANATAVVVVALACVQRVDPRTEAFREHVGQLQGRATPWPECAEFHDYLRTRAEP